ncbi:hypothetical protein TNCV_2916701 [Trichonephila clavipes]|nr:hypothetical protein TNCV_2916701 [Trichonephila clavipes]
MILCSVTTLLGYRLDVKRHTPPVGECIAFYIPSYTIITTHSHCHGLFRNVSLKSNACGLVRGECLRSSSRVLRPRHGSSRRQGSSSLRTCSPPRGQKTDADDRSSIRRFVRHEFP